MGEVASVVHSISKRLNELKNGDSLGVVAGRMYVFNTHSSITFIKK